MKLARRRWSGAWALALAATVLTSGHAAPHAAARCGPDDRPETGVRGDVPLDDQRSGRASEGYNCGLAVVANNPLGGRGGNANLAWVGDCAYVTGDGVAVVDVSDPASPVHVTTLHGPGSNGSVETIATVDLPGRHLLAAGRYGTFYDLGPPPGEAPIDLYDIADCAHPRLLTTFALPTAVHNLAFSADGRRLWTSMPLQGTDVSDPSHPIFLGNLEEQLRTQGMPHLQYAHEVLPSADGERLYVGGQTAGDEATMVLDVAGWPDRPARIVSSFAGAGHALRTATIKGRPYLLHSDESVGGVVSNGCLPSTLTPYAGAAEPVLTDIRDPARPIDVGTLSLEINQPSNCRAALESGVDGSSHYHDVDDPKHTTFALVSMWNAGLRLFDVRDPAHPTEVAYFNPGLYELEAPSTFFDVLSVPSRGLDQAWGHVRYRPDTGHIWLATRLGGFWVLELEPQVRAALGLPRKGNRHATGGPARRGDDVPRPAGARSYCTLAPIV